MKSQEQRDLENMALAAELARQLCHDFSNFIYNLYLQIEIGETSAGGAKPGNWEGIKQESRRMTRLLQEWDQFHGRFSFDESTIDLHQMIRQIAAEMASKDRVVQLAPSVSDEALWVGTSPVDLKHLLRLLIEEAFLAWERATGAGPTMSIQTENVNAKARIRIVVQGAREKTDSAENGEASSEHESLLAATCRSLAVRLGATIHRERRAEGLCVIQVEFPLSLMRGS